MDGNVDSDSLLTEEERAGLAASVSWDNENEIARTYVRFAIQLAVQAAELYRNAGLVLAGEKRDLLFFMAGIKNRNALILKVNDPAGASSILEPGSGGTGFSLADYFLHGATHSLDSFEAVFNFILKWEQRNLGIFHRLDRIEAAEGVRSVFRFLIRLQNGDICRLGSEYEKLNKAVTAAGPPIVLTPPA